MVDVVSDIALVEPEGAACLKPRLVACLTSRDDAATYVEAMSDIAFSTGYQSKPFLRAWLAQEEAKPFFLVFQKPGYGNVLLPLELQKYGIAKYCGGTHANGNFPVGMVEDIQALVGTSWSEFARLIKTLPDYPDAIFLERQHAEFEGVKNPFVFPSSAISPNVALSLSLEGGFSGVLERHHAKRKRKRQRSHLRKLEAMGKVDIVQRVRCEDVRAVLDRFFVLKAERFREQGICDVFQEGHVREMFAQMFMESCDAKVPNHVLKTVKMDDQIISIIGCTIHRGRLTVEFGTIDNRYAMGGPGDLLFYHAIEDACDKGLDVFDFGIGDEFYKRSWCEIETWHRDTTLAISPLGTVMTAYKHVRSKFVRAIKSNDFIWAQLKKMRRSFGWIRWC